MEWHNREELIHALIPTIPPGVAIRRTEHNRVKGKPGKPRVKHSSTSDLIYSGARYIVVAGINSLTQNSRIEVKYGVTKEDTMVRLLRVVEGKGGQRRPKPPEQQTQESPEQQPPEQQPQEPSKYYHTAKLAVRWLVPIPENASPETIETLTHFQVKQIQKCLDKEFGPHSGIVQIALETR
jgi:hypothetical protein